MDLRDYQEDTLYHLLESEFERECICLATGSGKTILFSAFSAVQVGLGKTGLILVNRCELLTQTDRTLREQYGIKASLITAKSKNITLPNNNVYLAMIETLHRRKKLLYHLRSICDYVITDECHFSQYGKILDEGFKRVIGFSATPILAKKNDCLKNHYHNIYVPLQVKDLIDKGYLCPARTYAPQKYVLNPKILKLNKSKTDFDESAMGDELSKQIYIDSVVNYVKKFCENKRTIIYNASIKQSMLLTLTLRSQGFNAYHVDGGTAEEERKEILGKLHTEQNCIISNVNVLTFGFDCPEIEIIILNRLTKSLALYIQMCGRGSRISSTIDKDHFKILDMTGNSIIHGEWQDNRDWELLFSQINNKTGEGEAPVKICPNCERVLHARVMECPFCNHLFEIIKEKEIKKEVDPCLVELEKYKIKVNKIIERVQARGHNKYRSLHLIKEDIYEKNQQKSLEEIQEAFLLILPSWCSETGTPCNTWHKDFAKKVMKEYFDKMKNENINI